MTNEDIFRIALSQSAEDIGCRAEDFLKKENVTVPFKLGSDARRYYKQPITCNLVSYGNNIVAASSEEVIGVVSEYISRYEFYHCFETPNMNWLSNHLERDGYKICFMAEYFLPDVNKISKIECTYEMRMLEQKDFDKLYLPEWRE